MTLVRRCLTAAVVLAIVASATPLRAQLVNRVDDGEFDVGVSGWGNRPGSPNTSVFVADVDRDDCTGSGSALLFTDGFNEDNYMETCILGIEPGQDYDLAAWLRFPTGETPGYAYPVVKWTDSELDCDGTELVEDTAPIISSDAGDNWFRTHAPELVAPEGAKSAILWILVHSDGGDVVELRVDGVHLVQAEGLLFAEGFEVDSTCRWDEEVLAN